MVENLKNTQVGIKEVKLQLMTMQEQVNLLSNINSSLSAIFLAENMVEMRKKYDAM